LAHHLIRNILFSILVILFTLIKVEKNDLFVLNIFSEVPTVTHGQISLGSYHGNAKIEFKAKTTKSPCTVKTLAIGNNRIKKLEQNDGCKQMLYSIVTEAERDTDDF